MSQQRSPVVNHVSVSETHEDKNKKRTLGNGYGYGITIAAILSMMKEDIALRNNMKPFGTEKVSEKRQALQQWIKQHEAVKDLADVKLLKQDITQIMLNDAKGEPILNDNAFGDLIHYIFDDMNQRTLGNKRLPVVLADLSSNIKQLFSKQDVLQAYQQSLAQYVRNYKNLHEIQKKQLDKPADLPPQARDRFVSAYNLFASKSTGVFPAHLPHPSDSEFIQKMQHILSPENITKIEPNLMAVLIPTILNHMNANDRKIVATEIIKRMPPKYFKLIADEDYFTFRQQIAAQNDPLTMTVDANGRALFLRRKTVSDSYSYRGYKWEHDHTHVHFGNEHEYMAYQSPGHLQAVKDGKAEDPNKNVVGEVHNVYKRISRKGVTRYLAIGYFLKISPRQLLNQIDEGKQELSLNTQSLMPNFYQDQQQGELVESNWVSFISPAAPFQRGMRFLINPKTSVEVSQEEYKKLNAIFKNENAQQFGAESLDAVGMVSLDPGFALDPVERSVLRMR